jgi:hypothetical protein
MSYYANVENWYGNHLVIERDVRFVDYNSPNPDGAGKTMETAFHTIQAAVDAVDQGGVVVVKAKNMAVTATDPSSYAENVTITTPQIRLVGIGGRVQMGLPQIKKGSGSTAQLTIQAPGCIIEKMGFNGIDATGGGILLDDDSVVTGTKSAHGTTILDCHFKNCVGSTATNAATGGAIMWSDKGNAWQVLIKGNRFYKNVGDIVVIGTDDSVPQDLVIEDNIFSGPGGSVDCNLYLTGLGSGVNGVIIRNNVFSAIPSLGGTNDKMLVLTGCVGILANNYFACEDGRTFGAAGDELVPTTVFMAGNFSEKAAAQVANGGDIYRT